eukprot:51487_1
MQSFLQSLFYLIISSTLRNSNAVYTVSINWTDVIQTNPVSPTVVVAYDPLLLPESPIHDQIWQLLSDLNVNHIKFIAAGVFERVNVLQLTPPSGKYTCGHINGDSKNEQFNNISLQCPSPDSVINAVQFASYGNPIADGTLCGNWKEGPCHSNLSSSIKLVENLCLHKNNCTISVNEELFPLHCIPPLLHKAFAVQVTCTGTTKESNFNNFKFMNEIISDLMKYGINTNLNTMSWTMQPVPIWFYGNTTANQIYSVLADNPYLADIFYGKPGNGWSDDYNISDLGDYFARIAGWYLNNGFIDSYGFEHESEYNFSWNNQDGNQYNIVWEVLNEPNDNPHYNTPQMYTEIYDESVESIWNMFDKHHEMKFQGLAVNGKTANLNWFRYFLNISNHKSTQIPLDYMSFHFYAHLPNFTYNN